MVVVNNMRWKAGVPPAGVLPEEKVVRDKVLACQIVSAGEKLHTKPGFLFRKNNLAAGGLGFAPSRPLVVDIDDRIRQCEILLEKAAIEDRRSHAGGWLTLALCAVICISLCLYFGRLS